MNKASVYVNETFVYINGGFIYINETLNFEISDVKPCFYFCIGYRLFQVKA